MIAIDPPCAAPVPSRGRRRTLRLLAAATAATLVTLAVPGLTGVLPVVRWRGRVLGAEAEILAHHSDRQAAEDAIKGILAELAGLESVFSLTRADSVLRRLNAAGELRGPPAELLDLLAVCRHVHVCSEGAFDPTVQPLWTLYADHFAVPGANPGGPSDEAIARTLRRVGFGKLCRTDTRLCFEEPGMGLTLNGVAQGLFTDRAYARLAAAGLTHALIDLGEHRALGLRRDGRCWRLGIADPRAPWRRIAEIELEPGQAIATSAGAGTPFDADLNHHHLFDPRTGRSAQGWASVSVVAPTATLADALSTALAAAPADSAQRILDRFPGTVALLYRHDGRITRIVSEA